MKSLFVHTVRKIQSDSVELSMKNQTLPDGVTSFENVRYCDDNNERHVLDIYHPNNLTKDLPIVIEVHGGAFIAGEKWYNTEHSMRLCLKGYIVINIEYTRCPETDLFGMVRDLFLACEWIKDNAAKYHGNTAKVYAIGDSCGAWMIMNYCLLNKNEKARADYGVHHLDFNFNALGLVAPVANIEKALSVPYRISWFNPQVFHWARKNHKIHRKTSIQDTIKLGKLPPCFIITTPGDEYYKLAVELRDLFEKENIVYEYCSMPNEKEDLRHCFNIMHPQYASSNLVNDEMIAFFNKF